MSFARANKTQMSVSATHPAPQIEMRAPGELKPNPRNARRRTKRQIQAIADSIASAGNLQPIVVDENDVILAGHGRLAAEKLLGHESFRPSKSSASRRRKSASSPLPTTS